MAACPTSALTVSLRAGGAAAGTAYRRLDFRNHGSQPCTLTGYPGVSFADDAGNPVGYPASRNPSTPVKTVTLAPGQVATASLGVPDHANYPPKLCAAKAATRLRVYPPNQRDSVLLSVSETVCTTQRGRPTVTPVRATQ